MSIGMRLKKLREERGMTQAELAAKVGTCQQTMIASIEADAKQMPLGTAIALSDIFGVTMDYLCKGKEVRGENYGNDIEKNSAATASGT